MTNIPASEVKFHPHSYGDPAGRLFRWNGMLYRGIRDEWSPFFKRLFADGVIQRLIAEGLMIDSEVTRLSLNGFGMVIRHRALPFPSYPEEWCGAMLRDAAVMMLDLLEELAGHGLTLKDGHPWNVLYDACRPTYVDLTSIADLDDRRWRGYDSFCRFCLYPLVLMSEGQERIARRLLPEYEGVLPSDLRALRKGSRLSGVRRWLAHRAAPRLWRRTNHHDASSGLHLNGLSSAQVRQRKTAADFARHLRREATGIALEGTPSAESRLTPPRCSSDQRAAVARVLDRVLTELRPASVLQALSRESYSTVAATPERQVVCFDPSPACVTRLYEEARDKKLPILPLVMDFTDPTPARGLAAHWTIPAAERFRCDLVLGLSLVSYGVLDRRLRFEHIVDGLAQFSRRWLVVDFPEPDGDLESSSKRERSWYTLEEFVRVLKQRFRSVTKLPAPAESRPLLLCEK